MTAAKKIFLEGYAAGCRDGSEAASSYEWGTPLSARVLEQMRADAWNYSDAKAQEREEPNE